MTEIELRHDSPVRPDTDSWVSVVASVADLAQNIANTPFVPESFRGSVPAVAAAILTGRELGLPPMISLRHIHVIKGKPGQSAELMRALVLRAGHDFEVVEATDTRAIVRGRRKGSADWQEARFTADQASKARIDLGGYPEDKLVARATTRLCRRQFADVIGGLPSVDELEDGDRPETPTAQGEPRKRVVGVRRQTPVRELTNAKPAPTPADPEQPDEQPDLPEPGQPTTNDTQEDAYEPDRPITRPQLRFLHRAFGDLGVTERAERLRIAGTIAGRSIGTSNDLTVAEATTLIDTLVEIKALPEPAEALIALIGSAA